MTTVWTSGCDRISTGVGVIQREVHKALSSQPQWQLVVGPDRPAGSGRITTLLYKLRQLAARTGDADVVLVMATPRPWRVRAPSVAVVYDLRWMRTAGRLKSWYRRFELRRSTEHAVRVLVISERTRRDLLTVAPWLRKRTELLPIGPGQCTPSDFTEGEDGVVLLVGASPHKRNRTMIEALDMARPSWCTRLVCVNLADDDAALARRLFGADRVEVHHDLGPRQMVEQFRRSSVYACLSLEEGFGIPFIEALCAGTNVLAVDQPLTRELLEGAAVLISDGDVKALADQLDGVRWPATDVRRQKAAGHSWNATATVVIDALEMALHR